MTRWITRKWTILGILFGVWLPFTVVYALFFVESGTDTTRAFEEVKFIYLSLTAFGILFSVLLTSFNSLEATANVQERIKFDRVENAFAYMHRWDTDPLKGARDFTRTIRQEQDSLSPQQLRERISGDKDLERSVIVMFNFFEELELSIRANRVDAGVLLAAFRNVYMDIYERFRPWIDTLNEPTVERHLRDLSKRWA